MKLNIPAQYSMSTWGKMEECRHVLERKQHLCVILKKQYRSGEHVLQVEATLTSMEMTIGTRACGRIEKMSLRKHLTGQAETDE